jgi:hypothetical protein
MTIHDNIKYQQSALDRRNTIYVSIFMTVLVLVSMSTE